MTARIVACQPGTERPIDDTDARVAIPHDGVQLGVYAGSKRLLKHAAVIPGGVTPRSV